MHHHNHHRHRLPVGKFLFGFFSSLVVLVIVAALFIEVSAPQVPVEQELDASSFLATKQ